MAVYGVMFMGMMPFGALISGHLANALGTVTAIIIGASVTFVSGTIFLFKTQQLDVVVNG